MPSSDSNSEACPRNQRNDLAVQQLVRYEAMFKLLDDIQSLDDINLISERIATQWKYFAKVSSWRMLVLHENGYKQIDSYRGQAHVSDICELSPWDEYYWQHGLPRLVHLNSALQDPLPPEHLTGSSVAEIQILPFLFSNRCIGLLSAATRHEPFSELDVRFMRLFGRYFADRIATLMLRQQAMEALISKATHDALTGLLNRGAIIEHLGSTLLLSKRLKQPLSVILCDIDFFKMVNDQYGHLTGDSVLKDVASRLLTLVRDCEGLGRYGGEEFLFVLFPCSEDEISSVADRMRCAIADSCFSTYSGEQISVTISLGSCTSDFNHDVSIEQLLKYADDALYKSKEGGRNQFTKGPLVTEQRLRNNLSN